MLSLLVSILANSDPRRSTRLRTASRAERYENRQLRKQFEGRGAAVHS